MNARRKLISFLVIAILALVIIPIGCLAHTADNPFVTNLVAGQHIDAGDIKVWNDGEYLYVKYETADGWKLTETHLAVVVTLEDIPQTKSGNPKIGKFEFSSEHAPPVESHLYKIPLDGWITGTNLYIMAHAVVVKQLVDGSWTEETGFGCGEDFGSTRWACYFEYTVQDGEEPGKPILNIPEDPVQAYIGYLLTHGEPSYFDVKLSGVGDGYDVSDDVWYDGWCADSGVSVGGVNQEHTVTMYLSTESNLPAYATDDEQWDKINYVLNQDYSSIGASWFDIQCAFYYLADETQLKEGWVWSQHNPEITAQIVEDANTNGGGFFPGSGQWMAIILDINDGITQTNQLVFIVVDP